MYKYSVIIPVYNRPDEVRELLESLTISTYPIHEVLIIEDGSTLDCKEIVASFSSQLPLQYYYKENSGQGFSRNFGFEKATGDYFVVFDSDCIIPSDYFEKVDQFLTHTRLDAYGGPDKARDDFTPIQKAISYSMTSVFTTGGIRGRKKGVGQFHPRSFNMGISKEVFKETQGYIITRMGEDIEFSIRIQNSGFKIGLIPNAYVFHKRRTDFKAFFKQLHFFGRARVNVSRFFPSELKLIHTFPALFVLGLILLLFSYWIHSVLFYAGLGFLVVFSLLILIDSTSKNRSLKIGLLSVVAAYTQLIAYGSGMIQEGFRKLFRA